MARADVETLLPLDQYAEIMAIDPDNFNQVVNPESQPVIDCRVYLQHGYLNKAEGRIMGRDDIAESIGTAEDMIQSALGFAPAPQWFVREEHKWPVPARGLQIEYPPIEAEWGYIIEGGQRTTAEISAGAAIVYSDGDGDGVLDTATITIAAALMTAAGASRREVEVFVAGETDDIWRIKNLDVIEDGAGNITIIGRRSYFVDPDLWLVSDEIELDVNANFLTTVDVLRVYANTSHAQLVWQDGSCCTCGEAVCGDTCQGSCMIINHERLGTVRIKPATYSAGSWTGSTASVGRLPDKVRLWYRAGWPLTINTKRYRIKPSIAMAITRLANAVMPSPICGCQQTQSRWMDDRKKQEIDSVNAAFASAHFGVVTIGSVFAAGVIRRLKPIGQGASIGNANW